MWRTGWLPGTWGVLRSLSIEESFYLAFPIFCLLLRAVASERIIGVNVHPEWTNLRLRLQTTTCGRSL
jgi:peptidoglycan/LPS O-acetylase OafA/YrhL